MAIHFCSTVPTLLSLSGNRPGSFYPKENMSDIYCAGWCWSQSILACSVWCLNSPYSPLRLLNHTSNSRVCLCVHMRVHACVRVCDLGSSHRKLFHLLSSDGRRLRFILTPPLMTTLIPPPRWCFTPPLLTPPPQHLIKGGIFCYYFIIDEGETNIKRGPGGVHGRADDFPCGRSGFSGKHNNGAHLLWRAATVTPD